jgi:nucleoside-diphosphate-sugar epimerase
VTLQIPSVEKFARATGWTPRYTFDESVANLLAYWRREARKVEMPRDDSR